MFWLIEKIQRFSQRVRAGNFILSSKKRGKKKKKKRTEKNAVDNNKITVCPRRGLKSAFLPFPRFWLKKFRQSICIEKGKDIVIPVVHDVNFLVTESR